MGQTVRLWAAYKNNKWHAYPEDVLKGEGLTEENMKMLFPSGQWYDMTLVDPFLEEHDVRAKSLQMEKDPETGQWRMNPNLYKGALVEVAVESWGLPYDRNRYGFGKMPRRLANVVATMVIAHCFDDSEDDEMADFLKRRRESTSRPGGSPSIIPPSESGYTGDTICPESGVKSD